MVKYKPDDDLSLLPAKNDEFRFIFVINLNPIIVNKVKVIINYLHTNTIYNHLETFFFIS